MVCYVIYIIILKYKLFFKIIVFSYPGRILFFVMFLNYSQSSNMIHKKASFASTDLLLVLLYFLANGEASGSCF